MTGGHASPVAWSFAVINPWTRKNPFLSLWLSGANAAAGKARAPLAAAMRRQQADLTRQSMEFWMNAWTSSIKPKPREPRP